METYTRNQNILYVDDEENLLSAFSSLMRREGCHVQTLSDPLTITTVLAKDGPFALVISDQRMPGLDGVGVLRCVRDAQPETIRVLLTGFASQEDTQRAINESGIARYMNKPWNDDALKQLVRECLDQYNMAVENKYLTDQVSQQNILLTELLDGTVGQLIRFLSHLMLSINPHAANQTERLRKLGRTILDVLPGVDDGERWEIERALDLFNVGIALLPPLIQVTLNKDGLQAMERYPVAINHNFLASEIIKEIPQFDKVATIIRYQRKNFDGSGQPDGDYRRGQDLPLGSRLLHILLDLEKLSTEHYRGREVLVDMQKRPGKYDNELIQVMLTGGATQKNRIREASLTIQQLTAGMVLRDDLVTKFGQILISANTVLTEPSIKILQQWDGYDHIREPIEVRISGE